jgi:hypothetical protein
LLKSKLAIIKLEIFMLEQLFCDSEEPDTLKTDDIAGGAVEEEGLSVDTASDRYRYAAVEVVNQIDGAKHRKDNFTPEAEAHIAKEFRELTDRTNDLRAYILGQVSLSIQK